MLCGFVGYNDFSFLKRGLYFVCNWISYRLLSDAVVICRTSIIYIFLIPLYIATAGKLVFYMDVICPLQTQISHSFASCEESNLGSGPPTLTIIIKAFILRLAGRQAFASGNFCAMPIYTGINMVRKGFFCARKTLTEK